MGGMIAIGEFSKLVDVPIATLRRWDNRGVLKAHRTPLGNRYYTQEQLTRVLDIKNEAWMDAVFKEILE